MVIFEENFNREMALKAKYLDSRMDGECFFSIWRLESFYLNDQLKKLQAGFILTNYFSADIHTMTMSTA
jgi:hypothetical protein